MVLYITVYIGALTIVIISKKCSYGSNAMQQIDIINNSNFRKDVAAYFFVNNFDSALMEMAGQCRVNVRYLMTWHMLNML
jgi:hypothetical protein